jgi:hypothetical protein
MSKTLSLCLTTQNKNNHDQTFLYRIADKIKDEFVEQYNQHNDNDGLFEDEYSARRFNPRTFYKNHKINEMKIWEWDPETDEFAEKTHISFFELVSIPGIESLEREKIVSILKEGFSIEAYNGSRILLLIGENVETYKVLELDTSVIKINENFIKLNKNITALRGYKLFKNDFINTTRVEVFSGDGKLLKPRLIYRFSTINETAFCFDLTTFEEKFLLYINQVISQFEFSSENRKAIKNYILEICENEEQVKKFFAENNFSVREIEKNLIEKKEFVNHIFNDTLVEKFCEAVIDNVPIISEKYETIVKENFLKINRELELKILENQELMESISQERDIKLKEISQLKSHKREIEIGIIESERVKEVLKNSIKEQSIELKRNISSIINDMMFYDLLNSNKNEVIVQNNYVIRPWASDVLAEEVDVLADLNEFVDALRVNLGIAGVEKKLCGYISSYITATIQQDVCLLITGKFSRNIVDAISASYCGCPAEVISVVSPEINPFDIASQLIECKSQVVAIENILTQNDNTAQIILNSNTDKLIVFTNGLSEIINFIPNSFWDRCNLLCTDNIGDQRSVGYFEYSDAKQVDFKSNFDVTNLNRTKKVIREKLKNHIFSKSHCATKAELIARIESVNEDKGIFIWLLCEVIPKICMQDESDSVIDLISEFDLIENQSQMLEELVW